MKFKNPNLILFLDGRTDARTDVLTSYSCWVFSTKPTKQKVPNKSPSILTE